MKHFLVTDDQYKPVYFDHPKGELLCPILAATQNHANQHFGTPLAGIRAGPFNIVTDTQDSLCLMAMSDLGEPRSYLILQLRFVFDLLLMRFGRQLLVHSHKSYAPYIPQLQRAVGTYIRLCEEQQSFLVHALEWLDVPIDIQRPARTALNGALQSTQKGAHALLLFDTKIVMYVKSDVAVGLTADELRILVVMCSTLLPPVDELGEPERLTQAVYIRPPEYARHAALYARVAPHCNLILIARSDTINEIEATTAQSAVTAKLKPYADFLLAKGSHHLPMLSYMLDLPGIVHFIYVDRTANKTTAPALTSRRGAKASEEERDADQKSLHASVWEMVYLSQQQRSRDNKTGLLRVGNYMYSFRAWHEDAKGAEVPSDSPTAVRSLELYSLFVGQMSAKAVEAHNDALITNLRQ